MFWGGFYIIQCLSAFLGEPQSPVDLKEVSAFISSYLRAAEWDSSLIVIHPFLDALSNKSSNESDSHERSPWPRADREQHGTRCLSPVPAQPALAFCQRGQAGFWRWVSGAFLQEHYALVLYMVAQEV